jgi:hypothetical protein
LSLPFDHILAVDFETAWDRSSYTLSKMTTEEYVRDPRFKAWGLCWKDVDMTAAPWTQGDPIEYQTVWVRQDRIRRWAASVDWSRTAVLAHNAQFDVTILSWVYGIQPAFIFDTLSMARALRGVEVGNSLATLADAFGLPPKGKAVHSTDGMLDTIPFQVEQELADYCKHDTWLCEQVFLRLSQGYPVKELRLIDMTIKMYTRPLLRLDADMLETAIEEERNTREGLLSRIGVEEAALASNPKFAEVLQTLGVEAPTKISKTTGEETLALAKNDALFQALLNSDNEDIALICEARLRVKSTSERTRAQRFLDIANRGTLPVPLSYYGAGTGRWTAAKGSAINMQNLKRGSFLRKAIMAPEEHVLVVGDLSQIEPRVLAWLSDYDSLLDIFRAGGDPYAQFGANMFSIPGMTKETHSVERQSAKSALLGCFGGSTPVLTQRGWVIIQEVLPEDRVWDGLEWVTHQGVVPQGEKAVLTAHGVSATSDHEIMTERGWAAWSAVLADRSLFQSALSLANSRALTGVGARRGQSGDGTTCTSPTCAAPAGGKGSSPEPICEGVELPDAICVQKRSLMPRAWQSSALSVSAKTRRTATGYLPASARSFLAALIRVVKPTPTMAVEASKSILRGLKTALSSYATLSASTAGTAQSYNLTESTTTAGMFPATFGSSRAARTCRTSAASPPAKSNRSNSVSPHLRQRMQTYDIVQAGPRNRYTILTDAGPIIVHNCGYQLGWASFAAQLLTGFLGAAPKRYTRDEAKQLGVTGAAVEKFLSWEENIKKMAEIPHTCTEQELLIHCLAAKAIIDKYRAASAPVVAFWELMGQLIERSLYKGKEYTHKCLTFRKGEIILPSGMPIRYPDLRPEQDAKGRVQWSYADGKKRTKLYAGKVTNNVVQGTARCVMTDGMLRVAKRYPVVGTVHDELLAVAPQAAADAAKTWVLAQMVMEPKYLPGIPLNADVGAHERYGLAKS